MKGDVHQLAGFPHVIGEPEVESGRCRIAGRVSVKKQHAAGTSADGFHQNRLGCYEHPEFDSAKSLKLTDQVAVAVEEECTEDFLMDS